VDVQRKEDEGTEGGERERVQVRLEGMRKEVQATSNRLWISLRYDHDPLDDRSGSSRMSGIDQVEVKGSLGN
jgi:hypothetical protein